MRINETNYGFYSYQKNQQKTINVATTKNTSSSAEVNISSRGREISQAIITEQSQRQNRIQELKQQIANGTYNVDSAKIAKKMTDFWKSNS